MFCNGNCGICGTPCFRGEIKSQELSPEEEKGASEAFDSPSETGLAVVENAGTYEVSKSIFGKEKVRRVK